MPEKHNGVCLLPEIYNIPFPPALSCERQSAFENVVLYPRNPNENCDLVNLRLYFRISVIKPSGFCSVVPQTHGHAF